MQFRRDIKQQASILLTILPPSAQSSHDPVCPSQTLTLTPPWSCLSHYSLPFPSPPKLNCSLFYLINKQYISIPDEYLCRPPSLLLLPGLLLLLPLGEHFQIKYLFHYSVVFCAAFSALQFSCRGQPTECRDTLGLGSSLVLWYYAQEEKEKERGSKVSK